MNPFTTQLLSPIPFGPYLGPNTTIWSLTKKEPVTRRVTCFLLWALLILLSEDLPESVWRHSCVEPSSLIRPRLASPLFLLQNNHRFFYTWVSKSTNTWPTWCLPITTAIPNFGYNNSLLIRLDLQNKYFEIYVHYFSHTHFCRRANAITPLATFSQNGG